MLGIEILDGEGSDSSDESEQLKERYAKFDVKNKKFTGR